MSDHEPIWCPNCQHDIDMHEADLVAPGCMDANSEWDPPCTCGWQPSDVARALLAAAKGAA